MIEFPMPGDQLGDVTVIASGWHTDEIAGVLALTPTAGAFYVILEVDLNNGDISLQATHSNIVPATKEFDLTYDFWGGR